MHLTASCTIRVHGQLSWKVPMKLCRATCRHTGAVKLHDIGSIPKYQQSGCHGTTEFSSAKLGLNSCELHLQRMPPLRKGSRLPAVKRDFSSRPSDDPGMVVPVQRAPEPAAPPEPEPTEADLLNFGDLSVDNGNATAQVSAVSGSHKHPCWSPRLSFCPHQVPMT